MSGRLSLILVFVSCALGGCGRRPEVPSSVPSVVVLSIDTFRADRLNSYGYRRRVVSPEIGGQSERVRLDEGTLEKLEALG